MLTVFRSRIPAIMPVTGWRPDLSLIDSGSGMRLIDSVTALFNMTVIVRYYALKSLVDQGGPSTLPVFELAIDRMPHGTLYGEYAQGNPVRCTQNNQHPTQGRKPSKRGWSCLSRGSRNLRAS